MRDNRKKSDLRYLILLILIAVGLPSGVMMYDSWVWRERIPANAREFTLTGHTKRGWIPREVKAYEVIGLAFHEGKVEKPVLRVSKGDLVVLKLRSSDVIHGFSLKEFGIFVTEGIHPGKTLLVSFTADKIGVFTFSCNAICGDNHKDMQGTLIVTG